MTDRRVRPAHSLVILIALALTVGLWSCGSPADVPEVPVPDATLPEATESPADADAEAASEPRGLRMNTAQTAAGYVFFNPLLSRTTYLVDVEGRVVHTWQSDLQSGGGAYLLDNGHLLRGGQEPNAPVFTGGGQAGRIQELTWDGEVAWDFAFANEDHRLHHDMALLPNGNVLAIAWEAKTAQEAVEAGRRPELTPEAGLWPDMIVEFEPLRPDGARVVHLRIERRGTEDPADGRAIELEAVGHDQGTGGERHARRDVTNERQGVPVAASPDDGRRPQTRPDLNRREHPRRPGLPPVNERISSACSSSATKAVVLPSLNRRRACLRVLARQFGGTVLHGQHQLEDWQGQRARRMGGQLGIARQ